MASDWLGPVLATNRKPTLKNIVHVSLSSVEKKEHFPFAVMHRKLLFFLV